MPHNPIKSVKIDMHSADGVTPSNGMSTDGTPHSPVKSIKLDFHDADGMTPTPQDLPQMAPQNNGMDKQGAPSPQTQLSPLEETLFKHWGTANGVDESSHSAPDNHFDFRGLYKNTNGTVHPPGYVGGVADKINKLMNNRPDYAKMGGAMGAAGGAMGGVQPIPNAQPTPNPMGQAGPMPNAPSGGDPLRDLLNLLGK